MAPPVSRRTALSIIASGIAAFWSLAAVTVSGIFLSSPLRKSGTVSKVGIGKVTSFDTQFRLVQITVDLTDGWRTQSENVKVYVRLNEQSELDIISARCSHLGCSVNWDGESSEFICPCHMGRYDESGTVIDGPPPAPLQRLEASIEAETVYLDLG